MKEKILVMHQSQAYAGTDVFALNLIDGLQENGYEVEIILNKDNKDIENFYNICSTHTYGHTLLTTYNLSYIQKIIKKLFILLLYPILVLIHLYVLYKKIKNINPKKIIIVNAGIPGGELVYSGAILCKFLDIKTIYTIHNDVVYSKFFKSYFYFIEYLVTSSRNIKFVSVSEYNISRVKIRSLFIKNIELIYNGIELNKKISYNKENKNFNIVFVGNISHQKGIKLLVEAFLKLDKNLSCTLTIYGKKSDILLYQKIEELCNQYDSITMILNEHNKDIIFKNKNLLILPSTSLESFGQVLVEAMSYGIPVLGSNGLGIKEVIEIDSDIRAGETFELGSSVALKEKIVSFVEDKILYDSYQQHTKYLFNKYFRKEIMINKYIKLLEEI
jgi:glycosyltransferase involved in cell wall biosynthesis